MSLIRAEMTPLEHIRAATALRVRAADPCCAEYAETLRSLANEHICEAVRLNHLDPSQPHPQGTADEAGTPL